MRFLVLSAASTLAFAPCACTSKMEPATMPTTPANAAACKLSPTELAARRQQLIPGLFQRAQKVEDIPSGLRFHFASAPGLLPDLARIMQQEQDCCSFLRIQLTMEPSEGPVTFDVTGPDGTAAMLRKL
jgi:hypothetical protein